MTPKLAPEDRQDANHPLRLLDTPEGVQEFCDLIVEHGTVLAACKSLGIKHNAIWMRVHREPEFALAIRTARKTVAEQEIDDLKDMMNMLATCKGKDGKDLTMVQVCSIRVASDILKWKVGKCNPREYGEQVLSMSPNITVNNVGLVCDEKTRQELIQLRESIRARPLPALEAEVLEDK